jgi:arsenical pump membrane protein
VSHASAVITWAISAATIAAILLRPFAIGEWIWAVAGAALLVIVRLVPARAAGGAALDGLDVYLFLGGMLMLSELARVMGLFETLGDLLLRSARGGGLRLFAAVHLAGIAVTALLSNDGTILLLTPAVLALTRRAQIAPLPFLYACAFVSNAASFVFPISNPANLVVFRRLPALTPWLATFAVPSVVALLCTFAILYVVLHRAVPRRFAFDGQAVGLSRISRVAAIAVCTSALIIVACAGFDFYVGRATFVLGVISVALVALMQRNVASRIMRETPWSIIPLVAALFVIVAAIDRTGALAYTRGFLAAAAAMPVALGNLLTGFAVMFADNLLNNLPAGVLVRYSLANHTLGSHIAGAALVGVDLGPNLSLAGSLATLLWLLLLRREGINVTGMQFLRLGILVTLPTMALTLTCVR